MLSQPDELIGTLVAERYRIKERLGRGGMGTVFLAEHEAIHKKVALKVLHPEYSAKPDLVERFQREAISASRVKHINVLEVFDFGELPNGCFYLAMEFLEGHDLADELERRKALPADRVLIIAKQICRALAAAHSRGVVHRDLKPENVFLSRTADGEEVVKIVDFGIAQLRAPDEAAKSEPTRRRLTRTGMIFGTPEYMSPEQAQGARSDHRVDVYATGVILFEMLTGAVPFTAETFLGVLQAHLNKPLLPMKHFYPEVQVSEELEAVIAHALEKDADKRFARMNDLAAALVDTAEGRNLRASVLPPAGPALDRVSSVPTASHPGQPTSVQFDDTNPEAEAEPATRANADTVAEAALPLTHAKEKPAAAVTALGSTTPSPTDDPAPPPRRSVGIWLARGGFVVACLAALGWYVRSTSLRAPPKPPVDPEDKSVTTATAPQVPSSPPSVEPTTSAAPAIPHGKVSLTVESNPKGATLFMNGAQVCDSTPCKVLVKRDEVVELMAEHGGRKAKRKVMAQKDQTVKLELKKKVIRGPAPKKMCTAEVMRDGIKVFVDVPCKP